MFLGLGLLHLFWVLCVYKWLLTRKFDLECVDFGFRWGLLDSGFTWMDLVARVGWLRNRGFAMGTCG